MLELLISFLTWSVVYIYNMNIIRTQYDGTCENNVPALDNMKTV